jgi:hypothetical protein
MTEIGLYDKNETLRFVGNLRRACIFLDMNYRSLQSEVSRIRHGKIQRIKNYEVVIFEEGELDE